MSHLLPYRVHLYNVVLTNKVRDGVPQMIKVSATKTGVPFQAPRGGTRVPTRTGCHPPLCGGVSTPGKQRNKQINSRQVNGEARGGLNQDFSVGWRLGACRSLWGAGVWNRELILGVCFLLERHAASSLCTFLSFVFMFHFLLKNLFLMKTKVLASAVPVGNFAVWQPALFRGMPLPLPVSEMKPLALLLQVLELLPQKFLRTLLIIFISEGCAYFNFKEISNLFQTGNCLGDAIRLFWMLTQLDSRGRCLLGPSQVHKPLPWELSRFPSPPGWTLWSWFCSLMLLWVVGNNWIFLLGKFVLEEFGIGVEVPIRSWWPRSWEILQLSRKESVCWGTKVPWNMRKTEATHSQLPRSTSEAFLALAVQEVAHVEQWFWWNEPGVVFLPCTQTLSKTLGKYEREGNQWATSLQPQLPQRGRRNSRSAWEYSETLSQR